MRRRVRHFFFFTVLLAISVCLLIVDYRNPDISSSYSSRAGRLAMIPITNVVEMADSTLKGVRNRFHAITSSETARELERKNQLLEARLERLNTQLRLSEEKNFQLARLMGLTSDTLAATSCPILIPAEVASLSISPLSCTCVINKGTRDGVEIDSTVAAGKALVGSVVSASRNSAVVQILLDPRTAVSAVTTDERRLCMVESRGHTLPLRTIMEKCTNQPYKGTEVVTSGIDTSIYPKGLVIGTISRVSKNARGEILAELEPAIDCHTLEEVVVIPPRDSHTDLFADLR